MARGVLVKSHDWLCGYTSNVSRDIRREVRYTMDSHSMERLERAFAERRAAWKRDTERVIGRANGPEE
jgi:hypothetical protein